MDNDKQNVVSLQMGVLFKYLKNGIDKYNMMNFDMLMTESRHKDHTARFIY